MAALWMGAVTSALMFPFCKSAVAATKDITDNLPAFTSTLPAQLAMKFNLDIVPVYIERDQNDNFIIEFKNRINPSNFENKFILTKELNNVLEKMIIKNPNQWIWTHDRWK